MSKTAKEIRELFVNTAIQYLGCKESNGSHKKIIDLYNTISPLPVKYKMSYSDAWCAAFVSAVAWQCGITDIVFPECGCGRMIKLYQNKNRWQENDAYVPEIGDVIFYDWSDSGYGDNTSGADHVGIVCEVNGNQFKVIEGNKSDAVGYRNMTVNGRYIRGFGLPDFANASGSAGTMIVSTTASGGSTISSNNYSTQIRQYQEWLNTTYNAKLKVDGLFGNLTKKAVVKAFQQYLNDTYEEKLEVDGSFGVLSKAASEKCELSYNKKRDDKAIYILQGMLYCKGYNCNGFDGIFGPGCRAAVKQFQRASGLLADGVVGPKTWAALFK